MSAAGVPTTITDLSTWQFAIYNASTAVGEGNATYLHRPSLINGLDVFADNTTIGQRPAVRITSPFTIGTDGTWFAATVNHAPSGCGVWPAFWVKAPNYDEIDLFEAVNDIESVWNIHSSGLCSLGIQNCTYPPPPGYSGRIGCQAELMVFPGATTNIVTKDNADTAPISYNLSFSGGMASLELNGEQAFTIPTSCSAFQHMRVIIDVNFCGPWAEQTYGQCSIANTGVTNSSTCAATVLANPATANQAYWSFASMSAVYDAGSFVTPTYTTSTVRVSSTTSKSTTTSAAATKTASALKQSNGATMETNGIWATIVAILGITLF